MAAASATLPVAAKQLSSADYTLDIAPYALEVAPRRIVKTTAYNRQVPGPLLRLKEGRPVTIDVTNSSANPEIVHWHGLFLPSEIDAAMEEGTPHIAPGGTARYTFTPSPSALRWYPTHTFAGSDLRKPLSPRHFGVLFVDP